VEVTASLNSIEEPARFADTIASNMLIKVGENSFSGSRRSRRSIGSAGGTS